jgi:hypothetical protein
VRAGEICESTWGEPRIDASHQKARTREAALDEYADASCNDAMKFWRARGLADVGVAAYEW